MHNWGRVFVVDATVCHEDGDNLERARRAKITKYSSHKTVTLDAQLDLKYLSRYLNE